MRKKILSTNQNVQNGRAIIADFLLDIFFPKFCVECGGYGEFVCFECAKKIEPIKTGTCLGCGKISRLGKFCPDCKKRLRLELSGIIVSANYEEGPTREIIHHLKYSGFTELAELLGELIAQRISTEKLPGNVILVPVPLYISREVKRGFNQAELIANYVSKRVQIPDKNALIRLKETETQVGLSGEDRRSNLEGAFKCKNSRLINGKTVFLVDDVTTTYSTLNECAKELKFAGAKKVYGLVVARG